jgi:long-subunit fatty acid transport protein
MKKNIFLLFLTCSLAGVSQQKSDFWDNVQFGGGVTLNFGSQTTIGLSPSAIYNFENGVSLGAGVGYLYSKINDFSTNVYSTSLLSLYQTKINIQLSGEFEYYFAKQQDNSGAFNTSFPALHLGVAYNQDRFAIGVRYDVLYDENKSIFGSPISPVVRFYF